MQRFEFPCELYSITNVALCHVVEDAKVKKITIKAIEGQAVGISETWKEVAVMGKKINTELDPYL